MSNTPINHLFTNEESHAKSLEKQIRTLGEVMESFLQRYLKDRHEEYYRQLQTEKKTRKNYQKTTRNKEGFYPPHAEIGYNELAFRLRFYELTSKANLVAEDNPAFPRLYIVHRKPGQKISTHVLHNAKDNQYSPALTVKRPELRVHTNDRKKVMAYITELNQLNTIARELRNEWISSRERALFILEHLHK